MIRLNRHHLVVGWRTCYLSIDRLGVGFPHRGDEVVWFWPWKQRPGHRWGSIGFCADFETLAEIDALWDDYDLAMQATFAPTAAMEDPDD